MYCSIEIKEETESIKFGASKFKSHSKPIPTTKKDLFSVPKTQKQSSGIFLDNLLDFDNKLSGKVVELDVNIADT